MQGSRGASRGLAQPYCIRLAQLNAETRRNFLGFAWLRRNPARSRRKPWLRISTGPAAQRSGFWTRRYSLWTTQRSSRRIEARPFGLVQHFPKGDSPLPPQIFFGRACSLPFKTWLRLSLSCYSPVCLLDTEYKTRRHWIQDPVDNPARISSQIAWGTGCSTPRRASFASSTRMTRRSAKFRCCWAFKIAAERLEQVDCIDRFCKRIQLDWLLGKCHTNVSQELTSETVVMTFFKPVKVGWVTWAPSPCQDFDMSAVGALR